MRVQYTRGAEAIRAVDGVDLAIPTGRIVGVVGESGSGKSTLASAVLRLIDPPGQITAGRIVLGDMDLTSLDEPSLRGLRGAEIALVPQNPATALDPVLTVEAHMVETLQQHARMSRNEARRRSLAALERVHIADPDDVLRRYPHQLSGGIKQRITIALALLGNPSLLIADEPTSALDATTQAQILRLVRELNETTGMTVLFITHNLGVAAEICDRVAVMYAGRIAEEADVYSLFERPRHPYTMALLRAVPRTEGAEFPAGIRGDAPLSSPPQDACAFAPRCQHTMRICRDHRPPAFSIEVGHVSYCFLHDPDAHAS